MGMSSTEPKCNSYLEFARDVLPRIKEAGYNCAPWLSTKPELADIPNHSSGYTFWFAARCAWKLFRGVGLKVCPQPCKNMLGEDRRNFSIQRLLQTCDYLQYFAVA